MLKEVISGERKLFLQTELSSFMAWHNLPCKCIRPVLVLFLVYLSTRGYFPETQRLKNTPPSTRVDQRFPFIAPACTPPTPYLHSARLLIFSSLTATPLDNAKYLFCRLCLRKKDKWHRLSAINYESELGPDGTVEAMERLCRSLAEDEDIKPKVEDQADPIRDLSPPPLKSYHTVKTEPLEPTIPLEVTARVGLEVTNLTADKDVN